MEKEKEIQALKERLNNVEKQLQRRSNDFKAVKIAIFAVIGIFLLLALIGIIQFVSAG
ncbi:hypothetical protein [Paenibacillus sp. DMB20]|uniref:hypothetical protein n=1 Tax=Paenibacillus sp. DMB20 TaxID=1642570 RepID=UPI000AB1CCC9|nr:hypothetical protein [Paenibacillus sp. DMB20]